MPLPYHPLYKRYKSKIPNAKFIWKQLLSLPLFPDIKSDQINYIIKKVKEFDTKFRSF